jgi:hypothetical protein
VDELLQSNFFCFFLNFFEKLKLLLQAMTFFLKKKNLYFLFNVIKKFNKQKLIKNLENKADNKK